MFVLRSHVSHAEQTGYGNSVFDSNGRVIGTNHDMPSLTRTIEIMDGDHEHPVP
jgi:hypothetical protein